MPLVLTAPEAALSEATALSYAVLTALLVATVVLLSLLTASDLVTPELLKILFDVDEVLIGNAVSAPAPNKQTQ